MSIQDIINNKTTSTSPTNSYRATVVDVEDPEKLGRVKVRIDGIHSDDVNIEHLPWSECSASLDGAGPNNKGTSSVPLKDAKVNITLDEGDWNKPIVQSASNIASSSQTGKDLDKSPITLVKGANRDQGVPSGEGKSWDEPKDTTKDSKYPNNTVTETSSGHIIQQDDSSGNSRLNTMHKSGTFTEMADNGDYSTKVIGVKKEIVQGDSFVLNKSNYTNTTQGSSEIKIDGSSKRVINGGEEVTAGSSFKVTAGVIFLN